jgi:bifunctional NMN adenylyltransferase/nudix hydrolase
MSKEFDLLVFVGRFQPFHNEHKRIIDIALEKSENVLVLIGSAGKTRTIRNPFTYEERKEFISETFQTNRLIVQPLYDKTYNETAWTKQVQDIVLKTALDIANPNSSYQLNGYQDVKVGLIGASKDNTSYYLKLFPQFKSVNVSIEHDIHATSIREQFFSDFAVSEFKQLLPSKVIDFMFGTLPILTNGFIDTQNYNNLRNELSFVRNYKKQWEAAPYAVKHATVDVVLEQSGHVLLVKRKSEPGKGLWALPGGHLNEYEYQLDGAIRELKEETKIKVPEAVLRGSVKANRTFDDPYRSTLGRIITQAYHIKLTDATTLPIVKGSDDAIKAKWIPISELQEDMLFDDHYAIITYFLSL